MVVLNLYWLSISQAIQSLREKIIFLIFLWKALDNKGRVSRRNANYGEAIQALDKAIEFNPNLADAWNDKG
jgi:tetratricopeptide (TPR) repeat protein